MREIDRYKDYDENVGRTFSWPKIYDDNLEAAAAALSKRSGNKITPSKLIQKLLGPKLMGTQFYGTMELYHRLEMERFKILREEAETSKEFQQWNDGAEAQVKLVLP